MTFTRAPHLEIDGHPRRVGVEIEYQGPRPAVAARALSDHLGGELVEVNPFHYEIRGTEHGTFSVEVDARFLKNREYLDLLERLGVEVRDTPLQESLESFLRRASAAIVPQELVTPPLPIAELASLEGIEQELRSLSAKGTKDSLFYAFGVHFNPEIWSRDVRVVRNVLQSFLLLYDGLVATMDLARRIGPFVSDFPDVYRDLVLAPDYDPDLRDFARDYVAYNPTRNRALDLLPLLEDLLPDGPWDVLEEPELVSPRPTFHYRLPDSRIDDPSWSLADAWWPWARIEQIADDRSELSRLIESYVANRTDHPWNHRWLWRERAEKALL